MNKIFNLIVCVTETYIRGSRIQLFRIGLISKNFSEGKTLWKQENWWLRLPFCALLASWKSGKCARELATWILQGPSCTSLRRWRNLTSVCNVWEAVPRSLFWAPNGFNELPEVRFKFPFILIGKLAMAFLTGKSWHVLKSWYTGGARNKDFGAVS